MQNGTQRSIFHTSPKDMAIMYSILKITVSGRELRHRFMIRDDADVVVVAALHLAAV